MNRHGDCYEPGTVLDDKFRVEGLLGEGGMGAIYEVTHELTHHRRALKLLHPHVARQRGAVERFLREASAAGKIGDPHIIETFDAGWLSSDEPFVLMELLKGETLADRLDQHPSGLPLAEVFTLFEQICQGVQAAHDAGIIHRDLKPANLFLCEDPAPVRVKILDFGISKFDDRHTRVSEPTRSGATIGTPGYMSLEQIDDSADIDERSDVYALGVILYECLTGRHPFPATSFLRLAKLVAAGEFTPVSTLRPELPVGVDPLMKEVLAPWCDERLPTVRALAERLAAIAAHSMRPPAVAPRRMNDVDPAGATVLSDTLPLESVEETMPQGPASMADAPPSTPRRRATVAAALGSATVGAALVIVFSSPPDRSRDSTEEPKRTEPSTSTQPLVPAPTTSAHPDVAPPAPPTATAPPSSAPQSTGGPKLAAPPAATTKPAVDPDHLAGEDELR